MIYELRESIQLHLYTLVRLSDSVFIGSFDHTQKFCTPRILKGHYIFFDNFFSDYIIFNNHSSHTHTYIYI